MIITNPIGHECIAHSNRSGVNKVSNTHGVVVGIKERPGMSNMYICDFENGLSYALFPSEIEFLGEDLKDKEINEYTGDDISIIFDALYKFLPKSNIEQRDNLIEKLTCYYSNGNFLIKEGDALIDTMIGIVQSYEEIAA